MDGNEYLTPPRRRYRRSTLGTLVAGGVILAALVGGAFAADSAEAAGSTTHSKVIRPGHTWTIQNPAGMNIVGMRAGGVKLTRGCNATMNVCRFYKLRPRRDCHVVCPLVAAWQLPQARVLVPSSSRWSVRVIYHRFAQCGCGGVT